MTQRIRFTKMQGAGNDYIYIDCFREALEEPGVLAQKMSDRHFGVGGDGLVLLLPPTVATADIRMRMFNADGSEAEMCGNASRCICKLAYDLGVTEKRKIALETRAGIREVALFFDGASVTGACVDMSRPILAPQLIPLNMELVDEGNRAESFVSRPVAIGDAEFTVSAVSMGNPHAVVLMDRIDDLDLASIGPLFENHPLFPKRVNTEFIEVLSRQRIRLRVWERGSGETLACGTGACAAVVACVLNGLTDRSVDVDVLGGRLHVSWDEDNDHVYMSGNATTVFEGEFLAG